MSKTSLTFRELIELIDASVKSGKIKKDYPVLILDDVFSELDETRRKCLINNFKNNQVIITSVEDVSN